MKLTSLLKYLGLTLGLYTALLSHPAAKEAAPLAQDPVVEARLVVISEELRCLVCQNESLAGSRADLAADLREVVREQIRLGKSDAQIKTYLVERYGDFVLYRPTVKPLTWLLWFGPFLLLIGALAGMWRYLRARTAKTQGSAELTAEERQRAAQLLHSQDAP